MSARSFSSSCRASLLHLECTKRRPQSGWRRGMVSCPSCSPAAPGASLPASRGACRALTCRERGQQGSAGGHGTAAPQPCSRGPPYMSWQFTVSRHCCNLSRQDLMVLISWAKAEQTPSASVLRHRGTAPLGPLQPRTQQGLPFPHSKQGLQEGPPSPSAPTCAAEPWPGASRGQEGAVATARVSEITFGVGSQVFSS